MKIEEKINIYLNEKKKKGSTAQYDMMEVKKLFSKYDGKQRDEHSFEKKTHGITIAAKSKDSYKGYGHAIAGIDDLYNKVRMSTGIEYDVGGDVKFAQSGPGKTKTKTFNAKKFDEKIMKKMDDYVESMFDQYIKHLRNKMD